MTISIATTALVHPGVTFGDGTVVEDFCIIGAPPRGHEPGQLPTIIGPDAHIRSHTVVYAGNVIGCRFQCGNKVNIRESNTIGDDVSIGTLSVIEHNVRIANGVRIHSQVFVPEYCVLEEEAWLGPSVVLTNARYPASPGAKAALAGIRMSRRARLGANCTVLPGVVIGENAVVGAGSVVTGNIAPGMVYVGNPARPVRTVAETGAYNA
ncbi:MAG: transferase [Rhodospirillaceae bacterium BRH_c57]|nr:MAG: transferase [Rhodospirillaceae bacterium BRH_c57]